MTEEPAYGTEAWARSVQSPHTSNYYNRPHDPARCCASVHDEGRSVTFHQCTRRPVIHYGALGYCRQHDPDAVLKARDARQAESEARWAEYKRKVNARQAADKLREDALDAIRQIAAGHNDPRALAHAVLAQEPKEPT